MVNQWPRRCFRWTLLVSGLALIVRALFMQSLMLKVDETSDVLPQPSQGTSKQEDEVEWGPILHVIDTRFMQDQAHLTHLARARLVLFETFCLDSIVHQTILKNTTKFQAPPFLWIIKTDPKLDLSIRQAMEVMIRPYPFIFLVGTNKNHNAWREGKVGEHLLQSEIYTGNVAWLRRAHEVRESRGVLVTRLDADDGLHERYIEVLQKEASGKLQLIKMGNQSSSHTSNWQYWCVYQHLAWNPTISKNPIITNTTKYGIFLLRKEPHHCITAGLTLGISVGVKYESVPQFNHFKLIKELRGKEASHDCGGKKCLQVLTDPLVGAIRSRTPTSAGMENVASEEREVKFLLKHNIPISGKKILWKHNIPTTSKNLCENFHVNLTRVTVANRYVQDHLAAIAQDNLQGQCTPGHSCKSSSSVQLHKLLNSSNTIL